MWQIVLQYVYVSDVHHIYYTYTHMLTHISVYTHIHMYIYFLLPGLTCGRLHILLKLSVARSEI